MFHFPSTDKNNAARRAPFRMTSLRHNPYVGSFHNVVIPTSNTDAFFDSVSLNKTTETPAELGLKRILYQKDEVKPTVLSQLKVTRVSTSFPVKRSFLASLKKIPLKVYSSSAGSKSTVSFHGDDPDGPVCAICIERYVDGDQLLTLSCSHCFHNECARKWFLQGCLNNVDGNPVNCPECRQQHQERNEAHPDDASAISGVEGISSASFFDVGHKLINEGGYDFMSDLGSETTRTSMPNLEAANVVESMMEPTPTNNTIEGVVVPAAEPVEVLVPIESSHLTTVATITTTESTTETFAESVVLSAAPIASVVEEVEVSLLESTFSDCGYPLTKKN